MNRGPSIQDRIKEAQPITKAESGKEDLHANLFVPRDPSLIPPRPWIMGGWLLRNTLTAVLAPGGVGKSTFALAMAISLATGRTLLGKPIEGGPKRVWYWNLEDDGDELERQIHACLTLHDLKVEDLGNRLFVNSGPDGSPLCLAKEQGGGVALQDQTFRSLEDEIETNAIDVVMIDPWVSAHQVDENSNSKIDPIAKRLARAAKAKHSAMVLVHHTSKPKGKGGSQVDTDAARGASALTNAMRIVLTLNRMSGDLATQMGVNPQDARSYVHISTDKHNRTPPTQGTWIKLEDIELENGDRVGAARLWAPPKVTPDTSPEIIREIQQRIAGANFRSNIQANDWAGPVVAELLGLDTTANSWKNQVNGLIKHWIVKGYLAEEKRLGSGRKPRRFLIVGPVVPEDIAPAITEDGSMDFNLADLDLEGWD